MIGNVKYDKTFNSDKLLPKASYILKNIPNTYYFGDKHPHPCRPPSAIYNIATHEVLNSLNIAIKKFEDYNTDVNIEVFFTDLIEKCEKVIANICSLYDECYLILISISKPTTNNPTKAVEWLKTNGYDTGGIFTSYSFEAIKIWQEIYNRLKHNNQKLSYFLATENENHVEGFYIEGYTSENSIGPDPTFHGKKNNMSEGISFKKFFKEIFLSFFYISDKLLKVVEQHLQKYHNHKLNYKIAMNENIELITEIWNKLTDMDYIYFPDEYKIKYAKIEKYKISYPHKSILYNPKTMDIKVKFSSDGVTTKYQLPMIK